MVTFNSFSPRRGEWRKPIGASKQLDVLSLFLRSKIHLTFDFNGGTN